ncbi:MAG: hypothetical protein KGN01_00555 [Patescibacteria group bacterium]|nr:hypothetical protein [Patescibacteria group bacterium]
MSMDPHVLYAATSLDAAHNVVSQNAAQTGQEITQEYNNLDTRNLAQHASEFFAAIQGPFRQFLITVLIPLAKFAIQMTISLFHFLINVLQALGNMF